TGISPKRIDEIIGVAKAYTTRVGMGPFPTELSNEIGKVLQDRGGEFGATTGRPRRCGWFDAPIVKYTAKINGVKQIALTKLDVLDELDEISINIGYIYENKKTTQFDPDICSEFQPVFLKMAGWKQSTKSVRHIDELPKQAKKYLEKIEELTDCKISILSVGEKREDTVILSEFNW
ncbi:MAG: adenylosuccinate synthetase, partial [candidate division WOR-3 bacterium]|nr:adenylosuccinate synthetase [candidate division WOR-3 bacterium]